VSLRTDRDGNTLYLKVRHHGAAIALAKMRGPTAVTMIQTWSDSIAADSSAVAARISQTQTQQSE